MENNELFNLLCSTREEDGSELNHLTVNVNAPYEIYNFQEIKNGKQFKKMLEKHYYKTGFSLSNEIIISKEIYINNKLFDDTTYHSQLSIKYLKTVKKYEPFSDHNIFSDLYHTDIKNKNSVIKFVNKYGLLESDYNEKNDNYFCKYIKPGKFNIKPAFEDYSILIKKIDIFKNIVDLWCQLENDNINTTTFLNVCRHYFDKLDYNFIENFAKDCSNEECRQDIKYTSKSLIEEYCTVGLETVSPVLKSSNKNPLTGYEIGYTSSTLLGVIYTNLYNKILNQKGLYKCKYCGKINTPTTKNDSDEYCKPDPLLSDYTHSDCNNAYNNMKKKYIKKILENKLSYNNIEKLCSNIEWNDYEGNSRYGRPVNEVLKWVKEYSPRKKEIKDQLKNYRSQNPKIFE